MDHSLDFVFLDESHEYKDVKDDIEHWLPKVKIGGTLGGDDMNWKGVRRVEDTLTNFEDRDIGHIKMKHFDHITRHLEINELDLKTETINRRRYVTPDGNRYVSITSILSNIERVIYRSGEGVGEKGGIRLRAGNKRRGTEYIVSVSPISETKTDS